MIDVTRRQFLFGSVAGLVGALTPIGRSLAQSRAPQPPPPTPSAMPALGNSNEVPIQSVGDHMLRTHANLADEDNNGSMSREELDAYRHGLDPQGDLKMRLGTWDDFRSVSERYPDQSNVRRPGFFTHSLNRFVIANSIELIGALPELRYPESTLAYDASAAINAAGSYLEGRYLYGALNVSLAQRFVFGLGSSWIEHSLAEDALKATVRSSRKRGSGWAGAVGRGLIVSNTVREAIHFGINVALDYIPPSRQRWMIL